MQILDAKGADISAAERQWQAFIQDADADAVGSFLVKMTDELMNTNGSLASGIVACVALLCEVIRAQPDATAARLAVCGMISACVDHPEIIPRA